MTIEMETPRMGDFTYPTNFEAEIGRIGKIVGIFRAF
jgi:hypothetical protein